MAKLVFILLLTATYWLVPPVVSSSQPSANEVDDKTVQQQVTALLARLERIETELKDEKILRSKLEDQVEQLKRLINNRPATSNANGDERRTFLMPTNCKMLYDYGHRWNGIYLVHNRTKIDAVYCDFEQEQPSKWGTRIGYLDIKTDPVHFYVQREAPHAALGVPIPFTVERLNDGNHMKGQLGHFEAPVNGTYHFDFTGVKSLGVLPLHICLIHKSAKGNNEQRLGDDEGTRIGNAVAGEGKKPMAMGLRSLSLHATLHLEKGDKILLRHTGPDQLYEVSDEYMTHFTGWLLEEELFDGKQV